MIFLSSLMLSLFITLVLIPILKGYAVRMDCVDVPCERKVHCLPMPKVGGIAMAIGALIPVILWLPTDRFVNSLLIGSGIIVAFGFIDDMRELGYKAKLSGQLAAALIVIFYGGLSIRCIGTCLPENVLLPIWVAAPLTLMAIIGVTNAINLSDGLDGLAGGIAILSFLCIAYLAYRAGNITLALLAVSVIGAIFGFLRYNTYPAVIFMGDAGSQLLGFLAVCLSIYLTQGNTPLGRFFPLLLLAFPIIDTLTVMLERISKGKSPFVADKNHFHHKLMRLGFFHNEAVFFIYIIQAIIVSAAFYFRFYTEWFQLGLFLVLTTIIVAFFQWTDNRNWKLKRGDFLDVVVKGRLRVLKEKHFVIKISFKSMEYLLPLLLITTCLLARDVPVYFGTGSALLLLVMLVVRWRQPQWIPLCLRIVLYLVIPFSVYLVDQNAGHFISTLSLRAYNFTFAAAVALVILTLKFTRRRKGFKATPMDFLVLFIALIVPNLPDPDIQYLSMGTIAAKIIVLLFGYEVMIGELRGELKRQTYLAIVALAVLAGQSLL
jgi:UDP-GlcNAc:undecaprenyl-phosphate GlcNAc-1-phosphate transferase